MTLFFSLISYQPVWAGASSFAAKKVVLGDNLLSILRKHGFSADEREAVLAANKQLAEVYLTLDTQYLHRKIKDETEIRVYTAQSSRAFRITKNKRGVRVFNYEPLFQRKVVQVEGRIYGSLLGSVLEKVKSNWVATRFSDAYIFDLKNGKKLSRGARYGFAVEKLFDEGQFIKYGEILRTSLELVGSKVTKKLVRHKDAGIFVSTQESFEGRPFFAPVEYLKFASLYSPSRFHPITKKLQPHLGIDFELPTGDPVFASRTGTVLRYGHNKAAGFYIVLQHSNGFQTFYNHLHRIDRRIRQGLRIQGGEKIAEVGCTGYCTRAHLHFAINKNGRMVDPIRYIRSYPFHMERVLQSHLAKN